MVDLVVDRLHAWTDADAHAMVETHLIVANDPIGGVLGVNGAALCRIGIFLDDEPADLHIARRALERVARHAQLRLPSSRIVGEVCLSRTSVEVPAARRLFSDGANALESHVVEEEL